VVCMAKLLDSYYPHGRVDVYIPKLKEGVIKRSITIIQVYVIVFPNISSLIYRLRLR